MTLVVLERSMRFRKTKFPRLQIIRLGRNKSKAMLMLRDLLALLLQVMSRAMSMSRNGAFGNAFYCDVYRLAL